MDLRIEKKTENKLLSRTEIEFSATSEGATPSRKAVKEALQGSLKADDDMIVIDRIDTQYGTTKLTGRAIVYGDKESLKMASTYKIRRDKGEKGREKKEDKKKQEGAKAAKKE